jgi:putative membrane protein
VTIPELAVGSNDIGAFTLAPGTHLAVFILGSIVVSLVGVRVAAYLSSAEYGSQFGEGA